MGDVLDLAWENQEVCLSAHIANVRAQATSTGEGSPDCLTCGEPIPAQRRQLLPGVTTCVACQAAVERFLALHGPGG